MWIVIGYSLLAVAFAVFTQVRGIDGFVLAAVLSGCEYHRGVTTCNVFMEFIVLRPSCFIKRLPLPP